MTCNYNDDDDELPLQVLAQPLDTQAHMRKYYYMEATLTEQETAIYNQLVDHGHKQAYLQILLEAVEAGTRHMYIYEPVPTPANIQTIGEKIAAMRVAQEASPYAAALKSTVPERIPTSVINAGQVQRELTQQSEEELQQTLAEVNRAADLGDPDLTGDAIIVASFLVKNNLLGGIVGAMGNLGLNTTGNKTAADQHQNLTIYQRNALDNLIKACIFVSNCLSMIIMSIVSISINMNVNVK